MDRKDWNRIGIAAAVLLVPGGFLLGATLLARRGTKAATANDAPGHGVAAAAPNADGQDAAQR